MKISPKHLFFALAAVLVAGGCFTGCDRKKEPPPPAAQPPAPPPQPAPVPPPPPVVLPPDILSFLREEHPDLLRRHEEINLTIAAFDARCKAAPDNLNFKAALVFEAMRGLDTAKEIADAYLAKNITAPVAQPVVAAPPPPKVEKPKEAVPPPPPPPVRTIELFKEQQSRYESDRVSARAAVNKQAIAKLEAFKQTLDALKDYQLLLDVQKTQETVAKNEIPAGDVFENAGGSHRKLKTLLAEIALLLAEQENTVADKHYPIFEKFLREAVSKGEMDVVQASKEALSALAVRRMAPPENLAITGQGDDFVELRWDAAPTPHVAYEVSANEGLLKRTTAATSIRMENLKPSVDYVFQVCAVRGRHRSAPLTASVRLISKPPQPRHGKAWTLPLNESVQLELLFVAAGSFQMGSENGEVRERPSHRIAIGEPFWLGKTEVTQAQWEAVMNKNPSHFKTSGSHPVEQVSWNEAVEFCQKLTARERAAGRLLSGYEYALPTEAQWEYACRAGTTGDFAGEINAIAWHGETWNDGHHKVAQKRPNPWGFYDMHGNVWEWCADGFVSNYYENSPHTDPFCPSGSTRAVRGGCWVLDARNCRSAYRFGYSADYRHSNLGFRLVLAPVR